MKKSSDFLFGPAQNREEWLRDVEINLLRLLLKTGASNAYVYAHVKTERLVTEANWKLLDGEAQKEWTDAFDEFEAMPKREQRVWRKALDKRLAEHEYKVLEAA